ncbi:MAG: phytanoyl-CoA dioxygenase family protein [Gammaproteobacteria bacterium]|nr:phytanoyl-CoA dioxygenase family protein [Gammaproteobacteria bacterium]
MSELAQLAVYGETEVGWDERTPPNETVDDEGNPFPIERGFGLPDPRAPKRRVYDDAEVQALREYLRKHNGIHGLEICSPDEVDRAARIFRRDGFVVVRDLLNAEQVNRWRLGCARILKALLEIPGLDGRKYVTETGRLPHRYSFGTSSACRQLVHDPDWATMIDLPTTTPILEKIFGSADYLCWGGGGDVCLPGAIEYQHLHGDIREGHQLPAARLRQAEVLGIELRTDEGSEELTLRTRRMVIERTPPLVTVNFLMSDLSWENGPIRQIPGTHASAQNPPTLEDEPEWMRLSTLVGARAGAGVIRDNRAWHGATPNLSKEIRALPNIEYVPPWFPRESLAEVMPHELWSSLSTHGQRICRFIKTEPGAQPPGAGVMHPLASKRRKAIS